MAVIFVICLAHMGADAQDGKNEIQGMNEGYRSMAKVKEAMSSPGGNVGASLNSVKLVGKFIKQHLPAWGQGAPDGVYSPAHMMSNAVTLAEKILVSGGAAEMSKAKTVIDQAMRLMSGGMRTTERKVTLGLGGAVQIKHFSIPNLIAIPSEWRSGKAGKQFKDGLNEFMSRRKEGKPAEERDQQLLNVLSSLMSKSYDGVSVDKDKAENSPMARELILINLELLRRTVNDNLGKPIQANVDMARGLLNYGDESELARQMQPGVPYVGVPRIVDQPGKLRT